MKVPGPTERDGQHFEALVPDEPNVDDPRARLVLLLPALADVRSLVLPVQPADVVVHALPEGAAHRLNGCHRDNVCAGAGPVNDACVNFW
jgi:hypothetical protein